LSFLSDVFDLPNSSVGGNYREFINTIVLQRGATFTRIMIAALTGALPSGRLEEVCCKIVWCFLLLYLKALERPKQLFSCVIKCLIQIVTKQQIYLSSFLKKILSKYMFLVDHKITGNTLLTM